jgi:hypothetical protein
MKKIALMAAAAAAAVMAVPAVASAEWYAGAAYTQYDLDGPEVGAVTGRAGYRVNPNFAVEGEAGFGVDDDEGVELDSTVGAYAVGILPLGTSGFSAHGRIGYQTIEIETPLGDADDNGVSYGAGVSWRAAGNLDIRADYTRMEGDTDTDAISLGAQVNF